MDKCLHCAISETINAWVDEHGARNDEGRPILSIVDAIQSAAEVIGDLTAEAGDRSQRRRALRFAHDAIDAKVKALQVGHAIPVEIPMEH